MKKRLFVFIFLIGVLYFGHAQDYALWVSSTPSYSNNNGSFGVLYQRQLITNENPVGLYNYPTGKHVIPKEEFPLEVRGIHFIREIFGSGTFCRYDNNGSPTYIDKYQTYSFGSLTVPTDTFSPYCSDIESNNPDAVPNKLHFSVILPNYVQPIDNVRGSEEYLFKPNDLANTFIDPMKSISEVSWFYNYNYQGFRAFPEAIRHSFPLNNVTIADILKNETFESGGSLSIRYELNPGNNLPVVRSGLFLFNLISSAPSLVDEPVVSNTSCNNNNDGSVKLIFDGNINIASNEQMRFYLYPANADLNFDPTITNPPQTVDDDLLDSLIDEGEGNFSGSFKPEIPVGEYIIIYQILSSSGAVTTAKLTSSFEIEQPSQISASATITQPTCGSTEAIINLSANGGNDLDASGTYSYQYRLNGGTWKNATSNPQSVTVISNEQTVEIKAIYTTATNGGCESGPVLLSDTIEAVVAPLTFNTPVPGIASSNTSNDGVISINYDGGIPNYSFELTKQNEVSSIFETVPSPTIIHNTVNQKVEFQGLEVGNYRITITDANGCSLTTESIGDLLVSTVPIPELSLVETSPVTCTDGNDGSARVRANYPLATTFFYELRNGASVIKSGTSPSGQNIEILSINPGNYELYVISVLGDFSDLDTVASIPISISNAVPVIIDTATPNNISCNGAEDGSITVSASGGISYQYKLDFFDDWTDLNSNTIPIASGGLYDLYLRNENGCEAEPILDLLLVEEPDAIEVMVDFEDATTNGGFEGIILLDVTGGLPFEAPANSYNISWTKEKDGTISTFQDVDPSTPYQIDNLEAAIYRVTITDKNGCSPNPNPVEIIIDEPGPLAINDITVQNQISCAAANDGVISANVTGTSPIAFEWTRDGAPYRTLIDENTITDLPPGEYRLFLNDGSQPVPLESAVLTLAAPTVITVDVSATGTCSGMDAGTITISNIQGGTPGAVQDYRYSIDDGATFQNDPFFENLEPGNYTVRVRDANNCDFVETDVPVFQFPAITLDAINTQVISVTAAGRSDGSISPVFLGGVPPFNYEWAGPNVNGEIAKDITGLMEATYTVTVTDANNCSFSQVFEITEPGELTVTLEQSVLLECNGDDFAEITALIQGGITPYKLEWLETVNGNDNLLSEDTEIIGNLSAGTYFLRVTDANGVISNSLATEITEPDVLDITVENTVDVLCNGQATGAISISVLGGTPPYSYVWSNGETSQNLVDIEAGEYALEVVDSKGCFTEITVTIDSAPDAIRIAEASVINVSEYLAGDGSIALDIVGGTTPYTISWRRESDNGGAGNEAILSELRADSYRVSISDANGCTITETYEITQPDIVEETITAPTCSGDANGSISLLVNKGNSIFTYLWNTGATESIITGLAAGSYTVTITGLDNGPLTRTYVVEDSAPIEVDLGEDRTLCADQELVLDVSLEDVDAMYNWTSDNGFASNASVVTLTQTGNYTVTVSTPTGCTAQGSIFVDISSDEIDAEFAVSSQVYVNETFVAVDISYPLPDNLEWILPDEATVLKKNGDEVELRFDAAGEYDIEIITTRGACIAKKTKKIIVVAPDGTVTKEDTENGKRLIEDFIIYPNPSSGKFTAEVNLTERGNISVKVFSFANNAMMASKKERGELSYNIPFDLSGLPAGVYAVLLESPYGNTVRKVILK